MEGGGGMVAVVQGLQDAGLAVTLLSPRYRLPGRSVLTGFVDATPPTQACQTVADSSTETVRERPKNTLYRSSYQMAHCQTSSFSPPRLPQYALQGFQQYRSSTSRTPDEEAFVESLRKYPISPTRSRSADLIERMLSYTQSRNSARSSNTRSAKSLPSKDGPKHLNSDEIPTRDTGMETNDLRPNFGYKRDVELIPVPTSNRQSRYDNQIGMYDYVKANQKDKKLKASEVRYLTNVKQCLRERLRQICDEEPVTICPKIQNRYSQHRRQYHRGESSQKSQKVNYCKNLEKCTDCKESMIRDSSPNDIQISPGTSGERKDSRVERSLSSFKYSKSCFCDRPAPCDCGTQPSRSILKPKLSPESEVNKNRCISICEYACNITEDSHVKQLKETILNWAQELPIHGNFNANDAMKRKEIINNLIDTLKQLHRENMSLNKIEDEVKKCLKVLPMWRPENKTDQESFENQLASNLLQKLKSAVEDKNEFKDEISKWIDSIPFTSNTVNKEQIVNVLNDKLKPVALKRPVNDKDYKEALKSEIASTLNDLPIEFSGSRTTAINDIADKLVEKLHVLSIEQPSLPNQSDIKKVVFDWLKDIPQISENIDLDKDDDVVVNDLITRLHNLQVESTDKSKEKMDDVITNWLSFVEEQKKVRIDPNTKNMLTTQLIGKLNNLNQMHKPRENITIIVQRWFDDIPHTLGLNFADTQKDLEMLTAKLYELHNIENEENKHNTMRQEILKWLQNMQRKQGRYVDSGTQENLVNKLVSMIKDESKTQNNAAENALITQHIWNWLESQPEFKRDNSMQYRDLVIELSKKLQDIKDKKGEITENDITTEVTTWFDKLAQERGIQIEHNNRKKLQDKLLSSICTPRRRKNWEKPINIQELVSKEVFEVINNFLTSLEENEKHRLKDQITHVIANEWDAINSMQTSEAITNIIDLLKQATDMPETQVTNLAHTLIEKVKNAASSIIRDPIQERPLILDNTAKNKLKSQIEHLLTMLQLEDKWKAVDTITDTLAKNYEDFNPDSCFNEIYDILKKAKVNETEAHDITNKILEITNQFRNGFSDTTYMSPSYGSAESLWVQKQMFMQRLEREITDFMEKVLNESSSFYKETNTGGLLTSEPLGDLTNQYNKFKLSPLKTSTPTKTHSQDMHIEDQYKNQMKEVIKNWITSLEIDAINEPFKHDMAHDIATDIIDRQRYIQHSKIKRTSQDEVEHLKYQIFKWTSKLPNPIDLTAKTAEIKTLIKSLQALGTLNSTGELPDSTYNAHNIITQDTDEFIEENIYGAIWKWLNEGVNLKPKSSEDRRIIDDHITDLSKALKNLLRSDPHTQVPNMDNLFKDEVTKCLKKLNRHVDTPDEQLEHRASELINDLKNLEVIGDILKQSQDNSKQLQKKNAIKNAVQNWCRKLPLKKGKTHDDMKDIVDSLAEAVSRYLLITDTDNINLFMDDILNNLKKLPLQFDKEDSKRLPEFTDRLIETLKGVLNNSEKYYNGTQDDSMVRKPVFKKAITAMHDNIHNWCENLPLHFDSINEDTEQANMIKQNVAAKLLKKIGELNLDPEIFHDDYLYEHVLKDEIEKVLDSLPKSKQLEEALPTLTENLIKDLLHGKEAMKHEIAGYAYKQQLRDAICKTLSSVGLPITEETPFEVLKDNLADAFISLHYVADDEELKRKFKDKIYNEVNKFCDDYLKQNPSTRINAHELNQELYKALKKVPVPKDESMRREVEQIRVKDIVSDWFKDLPLEETPSNVQEKKIISILAKRLHEIENEAEVNPDIDLDETMHNEISKWLKKFKLKPETEPIAETIKKNLIDKLKATKHSRKLSESTIRKSIDYQELAAEFDGSIHYPPSSLSEDDRAHLQRIRDRTSIDQQRAGRTSTDQANLIADDRKDASVNPVPIATGIQTEEKLAPDAYIHQRISQNESIQTLNRDQEQPTSITPQVIVKEYYWNSNGSPTMPRSGSIISNVQPGTEKLTPQEIPHSSTGSQTKPLPASKATITQETSPGTQNDSGTSTKTCLTKSTTTGETCNEMISKTGYNQDDYLQLNGKKPQIKSCQPCRGRAVLSGDNGDRLEAGTSKAFSQSCLVPIGQTDDVDFHKNRPVLTGNIDEDKRYLDPELPPPCFRRPIYQTPIKEGECRPKRKRSQQPCVCRNPMLKCTIRPQSPCQQSNHSNKSCYVAKKHCPKCWDGFCPHPSYLYFRQD